MYTLYFFVVSEIYGFFVFCLSYNVEYLCRRWSHLHDHSLCPRFCCSLSSAFLPLLFAPRLLVGTPLFRCILKRHRTGLPCNVAPFYLVFELLLSNCRCSSLSLTKTNSGISCSRNLCKSEICSRGIASGGHVPMHMFFFACLIPSGLMCVCLITMFIDVLKFCSCHSCISCSFNLYSTSLHT